MVNESFCYSPCQKIAYLDIKPKLPAIQKKSSNNYNLFRDKMSVQEKDKDAVKSNLRYNINCVILNGGTAGSKNHYFLTLILVLNRFLN